MPCPSPVRIIANSLNRITAANTDASGQRPSTDIWRTAQSRTGNGTVALSGPYTGESDTAVEVEILSDSGGTLSVSAPTITGSGSGSMAVVSIDTLAPAQTLTFTLAQEYVPDTAATLDFYGVTLAAKATGDAGNGLELDVEQALTTAPTGFSTLTGIGVGESEFTGPAWDWGQPATNSGIVPGTALRIQFEGFSTVHRAWKVWQDGQFAYRIDPATAYDIPADTRVMSVTGGYVLTLGGTEEYPAVTVYDFVTAVQARSLLASVQTAISRDSAPGGMAVTDIPLRTDAHALPVIIDVGNERATGLESVSVDASAPTENISIQCLDATFPGAEIWTVSGGVSGALANAQTGAAYGSEVVGFTIPALPTAGTVGAQIYARAEFTTRTDEEVVATVCIDPLRLGRNARNGSWTFTYEAMPPTDCDCADVPAIRIDDDCLGLEEPGMPTLDPDYQTRLTALYAWRAEFVESNFVIFTSTATPSDSLVVALADINVINICTSSFADGLAEIYTEAAALVQWDTYFAALQVTLTPLEPNASPGEAWTTDNLAADASASTQEQIRQYVESQMDHCRAMAGVVPKSDANNLSGDGCWRMPDGAAYWWRESSGRYLPAFTNTAYVSSRYATDADVAQGWEVGRAYSLQEFGFAIKCACEDRLRPGDTVTITIEGVGDSAAQYTEGDKFTIPVIAGVPALFVGGEDGTPTETWGVVSSADGVLDDWVRTAGSAEEYGGAAVAVTITDGAVPWAAGDSITLSIAGGVLRWRRDGGSWSEADIYAGPHDLGDGLTLTPQPGADPPYVAGDSWAWTAFATYGLSRAMQPVPGRAFAWDDSTVVLLVDLGESVELEHVLIALHDLPEGGTLTVEGDDWTETPAISRGPILCPAAATTSLTITITGGAGSLGWLWAGTGWSPTVSPRGAVRSLQYSADSGEGLNPGSLFRGAGHGASWSWDTGAGTMLAGDEFDSLVELLDAAHRAGSEPLGVVPSVNHPQRAVLGRVLPGAISATDYFDWRDDERAVSLSLDFSPVYES